MKIVKEGVLPPPEPIVWSGKCYHCNCEVEVTDEVEVKAIEKSLLIEYAGRLKVKCPTTGCTKHIYLREVIP